MDLFLIVYLSRLVLYLLGAYIAFSKKRYWIFAVAAISAVIGSLSFFTRDEFITGTASNLLGLFILMAALDARKR